MRWWSGVSAWLSMFIVVLVLTACRHNDISMENTGYTLPQNVEGTSDKKMSAMIRAFKKNSAINVISEGQDYMISIPSAALFPDESPRITWKGYCVLNQVAAFMKQFRKIAVNVTSYSNQYVSVAREQALTSKRARNVADYLVSQGIDTRLIFTEGAGSDKPVSGFTQNRDSSPVSRIEIIFRNAIR